MDEKLKKQVASFRKKIRPTKQVFKGLIKHECTFESESGKIETRIYEFYSDVPAWDGDIEFDYNKEPYDFSSVSGKHLANEISLFIAQHNLDDCRISITFNRDGYFDDAFLVGEVPKTKEDIEKEVQAFIDDELKKEQKKQEKKEAIEKKKKQEELKLLEELKKKYET